MQEIDLFGDVLPFVKLNNVRIFGGGTKGGSKRINFYSLSVISLVFYVSYPI